MDKKKIVFIEINNDFSKIKGFKEEVEGQGFSNKKIPYTLSKQIFEELSYPVPEARWSAKFRSNKWSGKFYLFDYKNQVFPTGCFTRVGRLLNSKGWFISISDNRSKPEKNKFWELSKTIDNEKGEQVPFSLRDYQEAVLDICLRVGRGCCSCATGSGKTTIFSALIQKLNCAPAIVFVPTIDLLYQTKGAIEERIKENGENIEVGVIGDGVVKIKDVTVVIIDSALSAYGLRFDESKKKIIKKTKKTKKETEVSKFSNQIQKLIETATIIIADESHLSASAKWQTILQKCSNAYHRYAFSATNYRSDGRDLEIEASFGKLLSDITLKQLIDANYLLNPEIYMVRIYDDPEGAELVKTIETKDEATGEVKKEEKTIYIPADEWSYQDAYKTIVVNGKEWNTKLALFAERFNKRGLSCLILVNEYAQGEYLESLIPESLFLSGKDTTKKRIQAVSDLREKKLLSLIATSIADQGLDIKTLDVLILAGAGGSDPTKHSGFKPKQIVRAKDCVTWEKDKELFKEVVVDWEDFSEEDIKFGGRLEQKAGRLVRKGSEYAIIIDTWPTNKYLRPQATARRKIYKRLELNSKIID